MIDTGTFHIPYTIENMSGRVREVLHSKLFYNDSSSRGLEGFSHSWWKNLTEDDRIHFPCMSDIIIIWIRNLCPLFHRGENQYNLTLHQTFLRDIQIQEQSIQSDTTDTLLCTSISTLSLCILHSSSCIWRETIRYFICHQ